MAETFSGRLAVIGMGYIGLPTAVALATRGVDVVGVDVNPSIVNAIENGHVPLIEPELAVGVRGAVSMGRLKATTDTPEADGYIIAVPTPFNADHTADLSYVRSAVEQIAPKLHGGEVIVVESTSPPGTTESVSRWMADLRPDLVLPHATEGIPDVFIAHCPERVLPGRIMIEIVTNDRVVGGVSPRCAEKAAAIYRVFSQGEILLTDAGSAEMAKLVENAYRDVNIAFANELSLVCDSLKLDVWEVIKMANRHPRVNILTPGPGVGGHCIAVDPWFIVGVAPEHAKLIKAAREVNDHKPHYVAAQVIKSVNRFREPVVACLGLTFKANVDDIRESPAREVVSLLAQELPTVDIRVADPYVVELPAELAAMSNVRLQRATEAIADADVVVMLVEHDKFKALSRNLLEGKVVFDTQGVWRR
jgi:UDP-N-acetyl-D-mannosaminuronic acid dehydrogenase